MKKSARGAGVPDPKAAPQRKPKEGGTPAHAPTTRSRKKVRMLASLGMTQEEIGLLMDLGISTVQKHYRHELRVGGLEADVEVLTNMFRIATKGSDSDASRVGIFWAKVRRRWHEVQRVIHGYDPEMIKGFVKAVVVMLRRELPEHCPGCKTKLNLPEKIATQMYQLSQDMASRLPSSEVVAMPTPALASDGLEAPDVPVGA